MLFGPPSPLSSAIYPELLRILFFSHCELSDGRKTVRKKELGEGGRAFAANGRLEWFWQQWRRVDSFLLLLLLLSPLHTPTHATRDLVVPLTLLCQQQFRSGMNAQNYNSNESQLLFAQINSDHFLLAPGQK